MFYLIVFNDTFLFFFLIFAFKQILISEQCDFTGIPLAGDCLKKIKHFGVRDDREEPSLDALSVLGLAHL